jgi:iron(III) transport system permease protein
VLSTSIWSSFEQANWGLASALSLVGMIAVFIFMYALMLLTRGSRKGERSGMLPGI